MPIQRIANRASGMRCLNCNSRLTGLKDNTPYTCGKCGQIHLVSVHPLEERAIITKQEYAWFHKSFTLSLENELKRDKVMLRVELKKKDLLIMELNNKIECLNKKQEKMAKQIKKAMEGSYVF